MADRPATGLDAGIDADEIERAARRIRHESSADTPGDPERMRRVGLTRGEMMAQGAAMRATLAAAAAPLEGIARDLASRPLNRAVIVGCGDSWFTGHGVRLAMERLLGMPVEPYEAFDFAHYGAAAVDAATLVLGLSSSGKTEPVILGLKAAAARGAYAVGLSNSPGSPLMVEFPGALEIKATRGGWPTQSSTAAMALEIALAIAVAKARDRGEGAAVGIGAALDALPDLMDRVAAAFDESARALGAACARADFVMLAGAGPHYAPAAFGAAKFKELGPIHALAFPVEEYHHYRTQKAGDLIVLVAPDAASHARVLETAVMSRSVGGRSLVLLPDGESEITRCADTAWHLPTVRDDLAPILYSVPIHLFAWHYTMARDALGLGAPRLGP